MKKISKMNREYRQAFEIRALEEDDKQSYIVEGYATTFDKPYVLWEDEYEIVYEVIDKNAFNDCDMSDVIMQYDHNGKVFARTSNNTLQLEVREDGLFIKADLGGTEGGRELYEEISKGYVTKMSFGFRVKDDYYEDKNVNGIYEYTRVITGIAKLYDVSAVSIPANDNTSISARNFVGGVIDKIKAERLVADEKRKKLKLHLELEREKICLTH